MKPDGNPPSPPVETKPLNAYDNDELCDDTERHYFSVPTNGYAVYFRGFVQRAEDGTYCIVEEIDVRDECGGGWEDHGGGDKISRSDNTYATVQEAKADLDAYADKAEDVYAKANQR